jgi:hypothetical protein
VTVDVESRNFTPNQSLKFRKIEHQPQDKNVRGEKGADIPERA